VKESESELSRARARVGVRARARARARAKVRARATVDLLQRGEDAQDALNCRSLSAKDSLIIGLFYGK